MKIVGFSEDIRWKDKNENFLNIEKVFQNLEADLFLLPEMFPTGFCMEPEEIADRNQESLKWMKNFAKNKNAAVCGSVSVKENQKFYLEDGKIVIYFDLYDIAPYAAGIPEFPIIIENIKNQIKEKYIELLI